MGHRQWISLVPCLLVQGSMSCSTRLLRTGRARGLTAYCRAAQAHAMPCALTAMVAWNLPTLQLSLCGAWCSMRMRA